jgi:hypothetical protein
MPLPRTFNIRFTPLADDGMHLAEVLELSLFFTIRCHPTALGNMRAEVVGVGGGPVTRAVESEALRACAVQHIADTIREMVVDDMEVPEYAGQHEGYTLIRVV